MKCPGCGAEMERGVVFAQKSSGIHWVPNRDCIPYVLSERKISACGGEAILPIAYGGMKPPAAPAWICKSCKIVSVEYA